MSGKNFFTKKLIMLLSTCMALIMLTNFSSESLRFKTANTIGSAHAIGEDEDDDNDDMYDEIDDTVDYTDALNEVFDEKYVILETTDIGDVSLSCVCDIIPTTYNITFTSTFDAELLEFNFVSNYDFGDVNTITYLGEYGELGPVLNIRGDNYYVNYYRDDATFNDLLQGIINQDENIFNCNFVTTSTQTKTLYSTDYSSKITYSLPTNASENNKINSTTRIGSVGIFFLCVAALIATYVIVSHVAEQIKAESNYAHNTALETAIPSEGLGLGSTITDQTELIFHEYRFGFTTFNRVGCAVAAAYNLQIVTGPTEFLSNTIYDFEKWWIEFSFGWGNLGSDPLRLYRYFNRKGIRYRKYISWSRFNRAATSTSNSNFIMAKWNSPDEVRGGHTFYFNRATSGYNALNNNTLSVTNISEFIDNRSYRFIVGYIIIE